jgi:N-acetyl-anhydromuramyl-L-alanine amidase AmpD
VPEQEHPSFAVLPEHEHVCLLQAHVDCVVPEHEQVLEAVPEHKQALDAGVPSSAHLHSASTIPVQPQPD